MTKPRRILLLVAFAVACAFAVAGCAFQAADPNTHVTPEPVDKADKTAQTFPKKTFYALIVGNDSRNGTPYEGSGQHGADGHQRSDVMMLVRVDPKSHLVSLISIPRDTTSQIDGEVVKINESYDRGGIEGCVAKVEEYTGVNIKYYFDVNFAEFGKLIDALGGVDVDVMIPITFQNALHGGQISLDAGEQTLDGEQALVFARVRKAYQSGDATRQYNDRNIIMSLISKVANDPEGVLEYTGDFMNIVHTNMSDPELLFYVNDFVEHASDLSFISASFPIEGDIDPGTQLWLAYYDPDTWASIMDVFKDGGDPNSIYSPPIG